MAIEFVVRDIFRLGTGTTVLACEGASAASIPAASRASLVGKGQVRQSLSILGERAMLNASAPASLKAIETRDAINLSTEEARSGAWRLIFEI
jgi:hypothetical protein